MKSGSYLYLAFRSAGLLDTGLAARQHCHIPLPIASRWTKTEHGERQLGGPASQIQDVCMGPAVGGCQEKLIAEHVWRLGEYF